MCLRKSSSFYRFSIFAVYKYILLILAIKRALKLKMKMFAFLLIYKIKRIYTNVAKREKSENLSLFGGQKALSMYDLFETPIIKVIRTHSIFLNNPFRIILCSALQL